MKFQILHLVIYPKSQKFAPRVVSFKVGQVNVITGASRTGKSAIIPIIDYCLASSECNIPIDTIRDYASWYGVLFQTADEQILICRKVPDGSKASNEFYLERGATLSIPPYILEANEKFDGIKNILNSISSVPYLGLSDDERNSYKSRLGFRDLMALIFQSQDIVANQNILFYKTHAHEHREKLRNWFPFILGAENIEILAARQRIQVIEIRLNQLRKEFNKSKAISLSWVGNMIGHLNVAREYGLIDDDISDDLSSQELLEIAKSILENIPNYSQSKAINIDTANREIEELEVEETFISAQIGQTKKRLNDLTSLKVGLVDYGQSVRKRVERLHISKWLKEVAVESINCPACGSSEHPNSRKELEKISSVFEKYEAEARNVIDVPNSFSREELRIKEELDTLLEQKKKFQQRFDLLIANDQKAQGEFQRRKSMFLFLGHLRASNETFEKLMDGGEFEKEIEILEKEYKELLEKTDYNGVLRRTEAATSKIATRILNHLKTLDVEEKYREIAPKFDISNLNISVLSNDGFWHFLAQVGSASNWVSFHLALMCALQEFFLGLESSSVPTFVIFDQPSQVYFPKLKKADPNAEKIEDISYEGEDVDAVKSMFKTIAKSIINEKGNWQSIILDHADDSIYGDIVGVYEVEVWRNGKKLIPEEWIEPQPKLLN